MGRPQTKIDLIKAAEENFGCIFREICASVPKERSAIPLETERSSAD